MYRSTAFSLSSLILAFISLAACDKAAPPAAYPKTSVDADPHSEELGKVSDDPTSPLNFKGKIAKTLRGLRRVVASDVQTRSRRRPTSSSILLDDVGFAQVGSFGGLIETPNIDSAGRNGLRYNNFHTTALCSPSRASLMAGRNPHSIGLG